MDLVGRHGLLQQIDLRSSLHPGGVLPLVLIQAPDNRRGFWRALRADGIRIRLLLLKSVEARADVILVVRAFRKVRQEELPDSTASQAHGMAAAIPTVEIADDGHNLRVGSPD